MNHAKSEHVAFWGRFKAVSQSVCCVVYVCCDSDTLEFHSLQQLTFFYCSFICFADREDNSITSPQQLLAGEECKSGGDRSYTYD